ncbi:MAG TPA: hypothetical protein VGG33_09490, partial [Polyangia bacterium]
TALLYPKLAGSVRAPALGELREALSGIRRAVASAKQSGRRTLFYFVFAGHGDVDKGTGYLELEDGRIDADMLEKEIIVGVAADEQHLILDACNSFFVVNPRKPGGRRWATPKDLADGFSRRFPGVGVFLSTSAEAEVYEWSELESGIFSHEVRSGLAGAADVNGDGVVSYDELAGFIDVANAAIPGEAYRPRVLARGPRSDGSAPIFHPGLAVGRRVVLPEGQRRIWIRNQAGERVLDLHKDVLGALSVVLPGDPRQPITVYERLSKPGERPSIVEYRAEAAEAPIRLAALVPAPASIQGRGPASIFSQLYAEPFGSGSLVRWQQQKTITEPVYGIGRADERRARHYLQSLAEIGRSERTGSAMSALFWGPFIGLTTAGMVATSKQPPVTPGSDGSGPLSHRDSGVLAAYGLSAAITGFGIYRLLSLSPEERAHRAFEGQVRLPGSTPETVVAMTNVHLHEAAEGERRPRKVASIVWGGLAGLLGAATLAATIDDWRDGTLDSPGGHLSGALLTAGCAVLSWRYTIETPKERLLRLYREDPDLTLDVAMTPLPGGGALGLSGRF